MIMLIFLLFSISLVLCSNSLKHKSIKALNSTKLNKTEVIDPSSITSDIGKKCYNKFSNLINTLPSDVKNTILIELKDNISNELCCDSSSLADKLGKILSYSLNVLTEKITNDSKKSKSGLVCYKNPNFSSETQTQNDEFVKKMLLDFNSVNSKLGKCIIEINRITLKNILYICGNDSFHEKVFNFEDGIVTKPKKSKEDNSALYNECIEYIKSFDNYSNTVLGGLIDLINNLIGIDSCNYYSNQFTFNPLTDSDDPLFPKTNNNINYSYKELLDKWSTCAKQKDSVGTADLYEKIMGIESSEGLTSDAGRFDINYEIIKNTFNLEKYDYFSIHCRDMTCTATCKDCFSKEWEKDKVLLTSEAKLDVSCCNRICVVYVKDKDDKKGVEVFYLTEDIAKREIEELLLKKIKDANKCIKKDSSLLNSTIDNQKLLNKLEKITESSNEYQIDTRFRSALEVNINIDGNKISISDYLTNTLLKANYTFLLNCESGACLFDCSNCGVKEFKMEKFTENDLIKATASYSNKKKSGSSLTGGFSSSKSKPSSSFFSSSSSKKPSGSSSSSSSKPSSGSSYSSSSSKPSGGSSLTNNYSSSTSKPSGGSSLTNNYSSSTSKPSGGSSLTNNYSNNYSGTNNNLSNKPFGSSTNYNNNGYTPNNQIGYNSGTYSPNNQGVFSNYNTYNNSPSQNYYTTTPTQSNSNFKINYNKPYKIENKIKITNRNYYDYTPAYYNYSPYRYDYYSYNRNYYYRPYSNYNTYNNNNNNNNNDLNDINDYNYDPSYWYPNISKIYEETEIRKILNDKINDLKIYIECCEVFCVTFVDTIDEIGESNKKRVYIDIILKNYAFIQPSQLSNKQKQCFVNKFYMKNNNKAKTLIQLKKSTNTDSNIFSQCEIPSVYETIPVKSECVKMITNVCSNDRFENIFGRVKRNEKKCLSFNKCLTVLDNDTEKEDCGDKLSTLLLEKGMSMDVHSLHLPCIDKETNISLLQITQSGEYIDVNSFTNEEKKLYQQIETQVSNNAVKNIVIDNSTPYMASQDIEADLKILDNDLNSLYTRVNIFFIILFILIV